MCWDVEVSDEFVAWFHALTALQRIKITASVELLETLGPQLGFPHSSQVKGSRFGTMRELRIQTVASRGAYSTPSIRGGRLI